MLISAAALRFSAGLESTSLPVSVLYFRRSGMSISISSRSGDSCFFTSLRCRQSCCYRLQEVRFYGSSSNSLLCEIKMKHFLCHFGRPSSSTNGARRTHALDGNAGVGGRGGHNSQQGNDRLIKWTRLFWLAVDDRWDTVLPRCWRSKAIYQVWSNGVASPQIWICRRWCAAEHMAVGNTALCQAGVARSNTFLTVHGIYRVQRSLFSGAR